MVVDDLRVSERDGAVCRSMRVDSGGPRGRLEIAVPAAFAADPDDASPFLVATLLLAMRLGEDLRVDGPVSPRLLHNLEDVQLLYAAWDPTLRRAQVATGGE